MYFGLMCIVDMLRVPGTIKVSLVRYVHTYIVIDNMRVKVCDQTRDRLHEATVAGYKKFIS